MSRNNYLFYLKMNYGLCTAPDYGCEKLSAWLDRGYFVGVAVNENNQQGYPIAIVCLPTYCNIRTRMNLLAPGGGHSISA